MLMLIMVSFDVDGDGLVLVGLRTPLSLESMYQY